ncbi:MAG TPA: hypothetical protein VHU83_11600 [Bryobacteraceae bacterium]|nr:hypothetical protein [Bryobacteraceae bacterium]
MAQVALLAGQFFSGSGSGDQNSGPNTTTSQVMAQSAPVQDVLNLYYITGRLWGPYEFGATGYVAAGANPVVEGSLPSSILPKEGDT